MMWGYAGSWMWVGALAFWILVVFAVVWAFSASRRTEGAKDGSIEARRILENRFARGEIDESAFEDRLAALERKR